MRKWSPPSKMFAVLGVMFALAAFLLVRGYAARVNALDGQLGRPVSVVVAARDLPRGALLDPSMLEMRTIPSAYAAPGAVHHVGDADGRALLAPIVQGEPLTQSRLAPQGAGPVAALVPAGLRAVSVPTSLPIGAVRAGDRVDVLATFAGTRAHAETVVSGLQVLRVERADAGGSSDLGGEVAVGSGGALLLLLASPDQAEQLAFAKSFADVTVTVDGAQEEVVAPEAP